MLPTSNEKPAITEPICLVSYQITHILLGGGPDSRSSFWKAYRRELEFNLKTKYVNYHTHLCRDYLTHIAPNPQQPVYFRNNELTTENGRGLKKKPKFIT